MPALDHSSYALTGHPQGDAPTECRSGIILRLSLSGEIPA
jgi:hypothetical protein